MTGGHEHDAAMTVTFLGGAETVTGSRFLVETPTARVLVDCGLFQGVKRIRSQNWARFPVDPASIDAVVLTHAHIDHSGYLPALVRDGFGGPIWATPGTAALCRILLPDSAHLQEEEARYANKRGSSRHRPALPLYTSEDAEAALPRFRPQAFAEAFEAAPGCRVTFTPAGHILGAASVHIAAGDRSVTFSGDVGRPADPVMRPPAPPPAADLVVTESTYGNRRHPDDDPAEDLAEVAVRTFERGGTLLIPSFAVGRAQTVLAILHRLRAAGRIPAVPVYLNSPMAIRATELLLDQAGEHRLSPEECAAIGDDVELVRTVEESKRITELTGPMIVLSASGMATGGRVLHHLRRLAPDRRSTVLFVGFQAAGTRGEAMVHGATEIKIFGDYVPVRAEVALIESLSAHADGAELLAWLGSTASPPAEVAVVHGEPAAADTLRREIRDRLGWPAFVPAQGESMAVVPAR